MEVNDTKPPFAKVLDALNGNTGDLKKAAADACGVTVRRIQALYVDPNPNIGSQFAIKFLAFANERRVPGSREFTISDLVTNTELVPN